VTRENDLERRIAEWLEDGPRSAPEKPITAAVAHARAHPRRRLTVRGLWRTAMTQVELSEVRAPQARHRALLAIGAMTAAVVVVAAVLGSGALTPSRQPSGPAAPAVAPAVPASVAPAAPASPDPAASPAEAAPTATGGFTIGDLAGTWKGDIVSHSYGANGEADPAKDTTYHLALTVDACAVGASCGTWEFTTENLGGTGEAAACGGTLTYRGPYKDRAAFSFQEVAGSSSGANATNCKGVTLVVTPFASGARAGVEETAGGEWLTWGLVSRAASQ
jgi:hypothetical protein